MADLKELNDTLKGVSADLERVSSDLSRKAEEALTEVKNVGRMTEATKGEVDQLLIKHNEAAQSVETLTHRLDELEQKAVRRGPEQERQKSLGERFTEDEAVKQWITSGPTKGKADMRVNHALTSLTTDADGSVGDAINQTRLPGVLELPQRQLFIRDLITPGRMDGNTLEYVQETGYTNAAAPVAEGVAKPESTLKFDLVSTSAKVIAHWMKASRQVLDDISQLRSVIDQRLLYGLREEEEDQILNGDGTGQNLNGIVTQATAFASPIAVNAALDTKVDVVRVAMLQAALAKFPATGIVLNEIDWAEIELTKTDDGAYLFANPQGTVGQRLWGLPVVATPAMTAGDYLVGAFRMGAQLFDRWDARVEVGYVNDDFTKNMVTILAEERLALAVYRPEAFITGDFAASITDITT